ncbi:hypothetical protein GJ744_002027 [Endocarpon pusillum]|uniref:BTB domain-containing protein n=1 Tax=Endocarpon pusillum TaxID=364733 RepID=A0A8H7A8I2_9EURO|nr:hypothetical protein GJ744_002027 [Endocarpon pusillum]
MIWPQEASEGRVDLSDDEPWIVARLILFMYFGQHPHNLPIKTEWQTSLDRLLDHPQATATVGPVLDMEDQSLSIAAKLAAAADKYQMPQSLMEACKAVYMESIWDEWLESLFPHLIPQFIASIRIIYQTAPAAGLRGRAITTAQFKMKDLQHRHDFKELVLATPEFAYDVAAKGLRQSLWCQECWGYVDFDPYEHPAKYHKVWDWIDHGKPQDWSNFVCRLCGKTGGLTEERPK